MAGKKPTVWGIHAGKTGDADTLFLKKNYIALGWAKLGVSLETFGKNRETLKARIREAYPDKKPGAIPNNAGQLYRFLNDIKVGDVIVYPSQRDKHVHVGKIDGPYKYDPSHEEGYPNLRPVKWLKSLPRTSFKQGALYEIGAAMSLFQVKNYADEFLAVLEGKPPSGPENGDTTISVVAKAIEENTRDFILKQIASELKGHPFTDFVAHLMETMGYRTRVSPEGPDGGIDILAHKDELGFEPPIIKVQVKSTEGSIGDPVVSSLYGKIAPEEYGLFVNLGTFTNQAKNFAKSKSNLRLIDGDELVGLILHHYDQFDSSYKGMIPLKRVYVPEPLEESEE